MMFVPKFQLKNYPRGRVVYWVGAIEPREDPLPIKIGYSERVHKRLREIQIHSPIRVGLIAYLVGTPRQEKEIHQLLREHNVHGEWFHRQAALDLAARLGATFF